MAENGGDAGRGRLPLSFGAVTEKNIEQLRVGAGGGGTQRLPPAPPRLPSCLLVGLPRRAHASTHRSRSPCNRRPQVLNRAIFPINYPERMYKDVLAFPDVTHVSAHPFLHFCQPTLPCSPVVPGRRQPPTASNRV